MSIHVISWVLKYSEETLGRRLVLLVLADRANDDGTGAWPSVATIAREARMTRRPVQDALRRMEESGAIRKAGKHRSGTTIYDVLVGGAEVRGAESAQALNETPGGAEDDIQGALKTTGGALVAAPEPSLVQPSLVQPSIEPSVRANGSQALVAGYVDHANELGVNPPRRLIGQVARLVSELLNEGQEPETVAKALRILLDRRLHPATLPSLIPEARAGPAKRQSKLDADYERVKNELWTG